MSLAVVDVERLRAELARFSYRPGWELTINASGDLTYGAIAVLTIRYEPEDSRHPGCTVPVAARRTVPASVLDHEAAFALWLQSALFDVELHESREWLRRDGVLVEDPHKAVRS